ncbi:MAG: Origin recognition complex subunit 2 [Phylliscum demangeonii]|nr:MAG: Origin recognition complex subunit 2 [Phylliscum demangeonii]
MERTVHNPLEDGDSLDEGENELAENIWNELGASDAEEREDQANGDREEEEGEEQEKDDDDDADDHDGLDTGPSTQATPSKRGRGRPRGSGRKKKSPTPPQDLPAHERYFFRNRAGGSKTSTHTLSSLSLLDHEEYFQLMGAYVDPHEPERAALQELHSRAFGQWRFEMSEGYSVCLHGWGSKRALMMAYAKWAAAAPKPAAARSDGDGDRASGGAGKIVVVNGFMPRLSMKEIINTIATALFGSHHPHRLGAQPGEMTEKLLGLLRLEDGNIAPITLIVHSLDSPTLRRLSIQSLFARLASHPSIRLLASTDHPACLLLWDSSLRQSFNFCFHDCTTFAPYDAAEIDVVDAVNDLLGRSGRPIAGKEGVAYVLKSLPENARNLYRVLVGEQLAGMEDGVAALAQQPDNDDDDNHNNYDHHTTEAAPAAPAAGGDSGIEYRVLYHKAVEEFICSSEMAFRTLLKEFHDHQMIASKKDALGVEMLWVPFRKQELLAILEDLTG